MESWLQSQFDIQAIIMKYLLVFILCILGLKMAEGRPHLRGDVFFLGRPTFDNFFFDNVKPFQVFFREGRNAQRPIRPPPVYPPKDPFGNTEYIPLPPSNPHHALPLTHENPHHTTQKQRRPFFG